MISIKNLSKSYGKIKALNQLDLEIAKGTIFGLLGPNGAGKTTLVSILNGLLDFDIGEIEVLGVELGANLKSIRKRSAFIPQALALYDNLSVIENLRFFAGIQNISGTVLRHNLDYAISVNRLEAILEQRAQTLSGGQRRRLNIAIGLLNNPELLYFDEPTVGIDPESRNQILETIRSFKDDAKTVIYTSHYMPEIEKLCDEVAIIDHGRIILKGRLATLLQEEKSDSVVFELLHSSRVQLDAIASQNDDLQVVDAATLLLVRQSSEKVGQLLARLASEEIAIRQLRYGTTNLEALFLRLTATGAADV
ncbi:MAG: ABC transporter ATP-binding protein [Deltaproteobacteria bacterium]|nr:MAG: ABC transporter ATP-binding protein [Deltaproteobacteria bacterium]